jgi:hypothetical protein
MVRTIALGKTAAILGLAVYSFSFAQAQSPVFYPSHHVKVLGTSADTLANPLTGGFNHPIYGNVDLNMDGRQDLVIFDREIQSKGVILPFLSVRKGNEYRYVYAPQYTHLFPEIKGWACFADYDGDGKTDLFAYGETFNASGSVTAFKNVSDKDSVRFKMVRLKVGAYSHNFPGYDKIFVTMAEIPAFADMDNDGDLDMLSFNPQNDGITADYYRNVSKDSSWSMDSLKYVLVDQCWGGIMEIDTGKLKKYACGQGSAYRSERRHSGSGVGLLDLDGDGDKELLLGDATYGSLMVATNGRINGSDPVKKWDTIIAPDKTKIFPSVNPVFIHSCILPSFVDVNADGKKDMVCSPMDMNGGGQQKNISWYYENTTTGQSMKFDYRDNRFIERTMLDQGRKSAPCFFDYEGDGKLDMLLGAGGDEVGDDVEQVYYYNNIGTASVPVYKLVDPDFMGLKSQGFIFMAPAVGDVTNDGKPDLLIGSATGKVFCYPGQSPKGFSTSGFFLNEEINGKGEPLDAGPTDTGGDNSIPALGDLDGDGKLDMLVGTRIGDLVYYKNIGSAGVPLFKRVTLDFAGIGRLGNCAPALGMIDGDDSLDLVLGSFNEPLRFYRNVSASAKNGIPGTKLFYNYSKTALNTVSAQSCVPALGDLDGDGKLDIAVGNSRGGIMLYTSKEHPYKLPAAGLVNSKPVEGLSIRIYPNPAKDNITLRVDDITRPQQATVTLMDMLGRVVSEETFTVGVGETGKALNLSTIANGVYTIRISLTAEGRSGAKQIMIVH